MDISGFGRIGRILAIRYFTSSGSRGVHRIFERGRLRGYHRERSEQGPGGVAPGKFLTELYAKPIGLRISIQKVQSS